MSGLDNRANRNQARAKLIGHLTMLDDEAFTWLVLACLPSSMARGARVGIWPDGLGEFEDRANIAGIRFAAQAYINAKD